MISLKQTGLSFLHILISSTQQLSFTVFLSFALIFCQFEPGVAYKSAAYKKVCISEHIIW